MINFIDGSEKVSPGELWTRLRALLAQVRPEEPIAGTDVPAIAALFDTLTITERDFIAGKMMDTLQERFSQDDLFEGLHYSILALVKPYIGFSNYLVEGRTLIAREFRTFKSATRTFNEYFALGIALASLGHPATRESSDWRDFFEKYRGDAEHCFDAFDVALAGTAAGDIETFGGLILSFPPEPWLVKRLFSFFPTLIDRHKPRDVEELLRSFLARVSDEDLRNDLGNLASEHGLSIWGSRRMSVTVGGKDVEQPQSADARDDSVPPELLFAHGLIANEQERGLHTKQVEAALSRSKVTVITSGYAENALLRSFQLQALELIENLVGRKNVISIDTSTFSRLPPEISGRQKVVFAFPMFLTLAKEDMGYSVCRFGMQRRLGVLYPEHSRFARLSAPPKTLKALLAEVRRNTGEIWCLQNYAIHEIIRQEAETDEELEIYFGPNHLVLKPAIEEKGYTLPLFRMPKNHSANIAYIYDLAGQQAIHDRIKAQQRSPSGRDAWLMGSVTDIISHDLQIPVGIGFTKYLVHWLVEDGRWASISKLVGSWAQNSEFQEALNAIGVESDVATRNLSVKKDSQITRRLRVV